MKSFILKRVSSGKRGTYGVLMEGDEKDGLPFALTLEDPWNNNIAFESCIPAGPYLCKRINSPKFGNTFEITSVPHRTNILFHIGNRERDTEGCILVGEQFSYWAGEVALRWSALGFREFMDRLKGEDQFNLRIMWV